MSITWTKSWSASDDGTVLGGNDIGNIQGDIDANAVTVGVTQTITGTKTFSGTVVIGSNTITSAMVGYIDALTSKAIGVDSFVAYGDDVVCYAGDMVYYRG